MPKSDDTAPKSTPTTSDDANLLHLRPPVDVMAVLPLIIDALDTTIDLYMALDPDNAGCCVPNVVLTAALAKIDGLLARAILQFIDIEAAKVQLDQIRQSQQQEASAEDLLADLNGQPRPNNTAPQC